MVGDERNERWLDLVATVLQEPLTELPVEQLLDELVQTFGGEAGSYNWRSPGSGPGWIFWEQGVVPDADSMQWMAQNLGRHPLIRWYERSGTAAAQTIGRVPPEFLERRDADEWREVAAAFRLEEQLSVPLELSAARLRAFVVAGRPDGDWSDEDLLLARRVQRLMIAIDRQASTLRAIPEPTSSAEDLRQEVGLTGREQAVLRLLADGMTAQGIGHRLDMSATTACKHLQHIYSKLKVRDRLEAVLQAQALGMIPMRDASRTAPTRSSTSNVCRMSRRTESERV